MLQVADVEQAEPRGDERARDDLRVDARGDVAVVRRVALRPVVRSGIVGRLRVLGRLVDLKAEVRQDERLGLVRVVDDPARADHVRIPGLVDVCPLGVLVELEDVRVAVLGERDRVLRD